MPYVNRASTAIYVFVAAWALVLAGASSANAARQASFDCAKAAAPVELLICGDDEMAALDREMGELYKSYRSTLSADGRKDLLQQQRKWLKGRLTQCGIPASGKINGGKRAEARDCLAELFRQRNIALGGAPAPRVEAAPDNEATQRSVEAVAESEDQAKQEASQPSESGPETSDTSMAKNQPETEEDQKLKELREAALRGDIDAQMALGSMYYKGDDVPQDYAEAAEWFSMAGRLGDVDARYIVGTMYYAGKGVPKNDVMAARWFRMAAEKGNAIAQEHLGSMYRKGQGVQQDYDETLKWYRKSADQGYAAAQNSLGDMYRTGEGVQPDLYVALEWYDKAASGGFEKAVQNVAVIKAEIEKQEKLAQQQQKAKEERIAREAAERKAEEERLASAGKAKNMAEEEVVAMIQELGLLGVWGTNCADPFLAIGKDWAGAISKGEILQDSVDKITGIDATSGIRLYFESGGYTDYIPVNNGIMIIGDSLLPNGQIYVGDRKRVTKCF